MAQKNKGRKPAPKSKAGKKAQPERRKPSFRSLLINYILLTAAFYFMMKSCEKKQLNEKQTARTEQTATDSTSSTLQPVPVADSATLAKLKNQAGDFAYALTLPEQAPVTVENEVMKVVFGSKGGAIRYLELKKYKKYDGSPLVMVDEHNQVFDLDLPLNTGKKISTAALHFMPEVRKSDSLTIVTMRLPAGEDKFLAYEYRIRPDDYMIDFRIYTHNLSGILAGNPVKLHWDLKAYAHEKDVKYENQFTALKYATADGKVDDISYMKDDKEISRKNVRWMDGKQWYFSSFFIAAKPLDSARMRQIKLFEPGKDTIHTKEFILNTYLNPAGGELNESFHWFHGPNEYRLLASYGKDMEKVIRLGWGIFGWMNKYAFIPLFHFLEKFFSNYGLIIILMTLIVRLVTSPLYYKTYVSQAKTKIIKPEMDEINKKYKDNPMKRQKEIMALQSKAGVNPLAGCVPSLLFIPIFYALFRFFPAEIALRQKHFLWIDDLSSYETFMKLPFNIPLLGSHISLFALLASVVMFFYMKMNQSAQPSSMPTQEGMPDLSKMMKWMLWFSPVMMFFFFNNYASGLSLYYFVSTLLSLIIVYVIKEFVIDEEKVRAQIEENKKKPKKQSKFQERLQRMMEEAERQRQAQQQNRKKR